MSTYYMCRTQFQSDSYSKDVLYTISSMDGLHDFSSPAFLPKHRQIAEEFCRLGLAFRCCRGYRSQTPGPVHGIFWAVTGICNMRCEHCYMSAPLGNFSAPDPEKLCLLMDRLAAGGTVELILTGGEIFTLDCLDRLLDHAVELGMDVSNVLTNATLITNKKLDMFSERALVPRFRVSFDGIGHHDRIRGVSDAETKTLRGIRLLLDRGYSVSVNTCVDSHSLVSLPATYECLKSLGIREWGVCRPMQFGCARSIDVPDTDMFIRACEDIQIRWLNDGKPMTIGLEGLYSYREGIRPVPSPFDITKPSCRECGRYPYLSASGQLMPCSAYTDSDIAEHFPNLLENDLASCLKNPNLKAAMNITYEDIMEHSPECRQCSMLNRCRTGCRASALINSGSVLVKDPYSCEIMKKHLQDRFYAREAAYDKQ